MGSVIPADVDELKLTPYGSTRALRPPLSYMVSAGVARMAANIGHVLARKSIISEQTLKRRSGADWHLTPK